MAFERTECILHQISPKAFSAAVRPPVSSVPPTGPEANKHPEALFQEALSFLREGGYRVTKPRELILRAAISFTGPFHAEDLLAKAREIDRLISLATVYRTLPMLLDSRLIREVELNREHRYYEVNREQSPAAFHIVCTDCGQVVQVQDECITLRERFLANRLGFKPSKLNVRIEATCLELLQTGECRRREPESPPGAGSREASPKFKSEAGQAAP
ncbi:MAG: transcriptional repressor [Verrucomicrobia bacterium]|nr:transcriptional repressor [Verrucomicrobiota bacterium]